MSVGTFVFYLNRSSLFRTWFCYFFRRAFEPQALESEKAALQSELEDRYVSASEGLKALSKEKQEAEEACSRLRDEALALEERAAAVTNELQVGCINAVALSYMGGASPLQTSRSRWGGIVGACVNLRLICMPIEAQFDALHESTISM